MPILSSLPMLEKRGGRRALVQHIRYMAAYHLRLLRAHSPIDWGRVRRLVMVCNGNICRSPYAAARARETFGIESASFGLSTGAGRPADPAAIRNAARRGIDITAHRTSTTQQISLSKGDLLLVMEPRQLDALRPFARTTGAQLALLGLWASPPRPFIHDPFGHSDHCFEHCYDKIDTAIAGIATSLRQPPLARASMAFANHDR